MVCLKRRKKIPLKIIKNLDLIIDVVLSSKITVNLAS